MVIGIFNNLENYSQTFKHNTWIWCCQILGLMYTLHPDIIFRSLFQVAIKLSEMVWGNRDKIKILERNSTWARIIWNVQVDTH